MLTSTEYFGTILGVLMHYFIKLAIATSLISFISGCEQEPANLSHKMPPAEVGITNIVTQPQAILVTLPGRSQAFLQAEVRPQVSGIILNRGFIEGGLVEKGQSLYQIDAETHQAVFESTLADLASANANLYATKAKINRFEQLLESNSISEQEFDEAQASYQMALAKLSVAKAAVNTAKINLQYTKVKAPIAGRIGRSAVTVGALVTANQSQNLALIQQLDPIYVDVVQSSTQILSLKAKLRNGELQVPENAEVELTLEDGTKYPHLGLMQFSEVQVDENTGSVTLRAQFPNPEGLILPGMYLQAKINLGIDPTAILVPQKAITRNIKGQAIAMIVNDENIVETKVVITDQVINNQWRVTKGLTTGDKVIISGFQKIRPGASVVPTEVMADHVVSQQLIK